LWRENGTKTVGEGKLAIFGRVSNQQKSRATKTDEEKKWENVGLRSDTRKRRGDSLKAEGQSQSKVMGGLPR